MSNAVDIFNFLLKEGCCKACSLRYLQDRSVDFSSIDTYIKMKNLFSPISINEECETKKYKLNPCSLCLGLLQESIIDAIVQDIPIDKIEAYDSKVFTCSISIPAAILIREHTRKLLLLQKFPDFYDKEVNEVPLNKAWKLMIKDKLAKVVNKDFENSDICSFSVDIVMDYADNNQELLIIKSLLPKNSKLKKSRELYSRNSVGSILANCPDELFQTVIKTPPDIPTKYLTCKTITCKHNSIYMAGRYCKYSRKLSQSPWIIDGVKMMETSVEEMIFENIQQILGTPTSCLKFSASGREDCDVRCLGKGRPFYVEMLDPKKTDISFQEFRQLEAEVNKSSLLKVRNLQLVKREEVSTVKQGEEKKTKNYIALCRVNGIVTEDLLNKLNNCCPVTLKQKTPIRVLHRRPLALREKTIHEMKAEAINGYDDLFKLHILAQAGTYVKEFVHGDFGRTTPNVGGIINMDADIIALDVVAINLDWPKEINAENDE